MPQEVARREAEEIERLERAAMGGMLVPAESASQGTAAEPFADPAASASAPQLGAAAEPYPEMASRPAAEQMAADGQSAAVGQQHPAEPDVGELPETATANGVLQQGRIEGAPSAPCFHAFIHAHAAAGDLRCVRGLITCIFGIAWSSRVGWLLWLWPMRGRSKQLHRHQPYWEDPPLPLAPRARAR